MKSINRKHNRCHVPQCTREVNASIHMIPKQSKNKNAHKDLIRKKWFKVLNIEPSQTDSVYYVCSNHFSPEDFKERRAGTGRPRLKNDAVPSVNLPSSSTKNTGDAEYQIHKKGLHENDHEEAEESQKMYAECFYPNLEFQDVDEIEEFVLPD